MNRETVMEQLEREAGYAQRSWSRDLLIETYGKAKMARQLEKMLLRAVERGRVVENLILSDNQKYLAIVWADCEPTTLCLEGRNGVDVIRAVTASL